MVQVSMPRGPQGRLEVDPRPARLRATTRIGQAGIPASRLAGGPANPSAGAVSVYTLAALLALLVHVDRLGRLLRGGRRPTATADRSATAHPPQVGNPG
jgi:hypothetical protein